MTRTLTPDQTARLMVWNTAETKAWLNAVEQNGLRFDNLPHEQQEPVRALQALHTQQGMEKINAITVAS